MSSVRRRRLIATSVAAVSVLALGGCTRGFNEQTNQQYQAAVGANQRGEVDILNALIVVNDDKSASLAAVLVSHTDTAQALSSVTVTTMDGAELPVRSTKMQLPLPKDGSASVGVASDAGGFRITSGAEAGYYVKVTFNFTDSASMTIDAPVVARTEIYDSIPG